MKLGICVSAAALVATLAACGTVAPTTRSTITPDDGTVTGTFMRVGGPLGSGGTQPRPVPLPGTLIFSAGHHRTIDVRVGENGRFAVSLRAGHYVVTGRSPSIMTQLASGTAVEQQCTQAIPVTVVAGRTVHLAVICPVP